jgi:hypothetical protein
MERMSPVFFKKISWLLHGLVQNFAKNTLAPDMFSHQTPITQSIFANRAS